MSDVKIPSFKKSKLYDLVFTHRSFLNESLETIESNERLEFLGDSILSFVVSSYIYKKYPQLKEGELTNLRSSLTNTNTLYTVSSKLTLGKMLKLSKGEEVGGGRINRTILANTFEALIGGLYIDQGLEVASNFIEEVLLKDLSELALDNLKDPKSMLQEKVQQQYKSSPIYKTLKEEGPDHAKKYTVGVFVNDEQVGQGLGNSKQEAEKQAAGDALLILEQS